MPYRPSWYPPPKPWTSFYTHSDGCKSSSLYSFERNDCTVGAVANATGLSYNEAHERLKAHGRKDKRGCRFFKEFVKTKLSDFDIEIQDHKITVGQFMKMKPIGSYIISTKNHAFCIKDGYIVDNHLSGQKKKIQWFARIKKKDLTPAPEVTNFYDKLKQDIEGLKNGNP